MNRANPKIVCLQETKLGDRDFNPGLNYSFYKSATPVSLHAKGGTAIIVSKATQHSVVNIHTPLQAVAVRILLDKYITICSLYLPDNFSLSELQNLITQLPSPFLLLGDFNAHNPMWGGEILDSKGKIVEDLIDSNPISVLNDGTFTYHNIYTNSKSAIDLSICSSSIFLDFTWWVDDHLNGSDHFPVHLKANNNSSSSATPKWKLEEADWVGYARDIKLERKFESFANHIEAYEYLVDEMLNSGNAHIPKTKATPRRPTVPWWNKTCSKLRRTTRKFYRQYRNSSSPETRSLYQRAVATQRNYYKKAKRESWICYINGISSQTTTREVWKKIRKLRGKYVPSPLPSLKVGNKIVTDSEEVANKLGEHFCNISKSKRCQLFNKKRKNFNITLNMNSGKYDSYNIRFSYKELINALSSTESSAPGEDTIVYDMIKHLPEYGKVFLLKIINKIWDTGILPKSWKISLIIPVKKPNKDATDASSYRPIALTSCLCKLMEKMINVRLVWYLEKNNLISPFQFGFRKNRSTLDPLLRLSNQIQQGFASQKQTVGVFFDLEKAYDTTWRQGILNELCELGFKGNMLRFLKNFLANRFIKVKVGNKTSNPFKQEEGVPQGSILSVTLFSIAINKVASTVSLPVSCSLFVDDLAIYCTSYDAVSACRHLQTAIDKISKWADDNGFRFSPQKTVAVRFTRSRRVEVVPFLKLKGNILPYEDQVKFLGVIFDKGLTWGPHIRKLKEEVKKSLNILKVVSSYDWGADRKSLLRLYNSLCKSKIDYACQIYSSAAKSHLKDLDVVHNLGLRICTGAFRTSPVESIYVDAGELPLDLRRQELGLRYMTRIKSSPQNPCFKAFNCNFNQFQKARASKPFLVRLNDEVEDRDLKRQKVTEVTYPNFPPWLLPEFNICPKILTKKDTSEEECKAQFLRHDCENHAKHTRVFTDGSKSPDGVGCAVYLHDTIYQAKLPPVASIFTAELTAITEALELISQRHESEFVIYTDSFSSILAIQHFNSFNPLVRKAQEWLFKLHSKYKIHFCWVPSHVGIQQNEIVDSAAKAAASDPDLSITRRQIPHSDMKKPIREYVLSKWQERWTSPLYINNKYRKIRPSVTPWFSSCQRNRRTERILTRLRIGHSRVTHSFLLEGSSPPLCDDCQVQLTVQHIMVDCSMLNEKRHLYQLDGKSLDALLGEDANVEDIISFLKDADFYFKL